MLSAGAKPTQSTEKKSRTNHAGSPPQDKDLEVSNVLLSEHRKKTWWLASADAYRKLCESGRMSFDVSLATVLGNMLTGILETAVLREFPSDS